ncbi:MAG TPA: hypothetical protein VKG92_00560, partial [Flavobacteriales bacterium]|nr:hypothetical protein [Flavobacteriales bacterium]
IKDAFPSVEAVHAAAPVLPRWIWVKFRPRRTAMDLSFGDLSIKAKDVRVILWQDPSPAKLGLTVIIKGYKEADNDVYDQVAYLMLDGALGEYDMETKVGGIVVLGSSPSPTMKEWDLDELPAAFDQALQTKRSK